MASGSSSDQPISVPSDASTYPDFKAYHQPAPEDRIASKKITLNKTSSFSKDRNGPIVVKDYLDGTFKLEGSQSEKVEMQTELLFEAANFQKRRGWFETDIAKGAAASKSEFDFWTVASQFDGAKNVAPLAQKHLTCYSAMGDVERCHKITSRHRTKGSNRKLDSTTQAYCEIAISESNKRRREDSQSKGHTVMDAFRSRMRAAVRARKEQEGFMKQGR